MSARLRFQTSTTSATLWFLMYVAYIEYLPGLENLGVHILTVQYATVLMHVEGGGCVGEVAV